VVARLAGIAILVMGLAPRASGEPRAEGAEAPARRVASAEWRRGKQLYAAGDYVSAVEAFQRGYDAYPLPGFLVNIGQCQRRLGHLKEAVIAYQQFLDNAPSSSPLRAEVEDALAELKTSPREREPAPEPMRSGAAPAATPPAPTPAARESAAPPGTSLAVEATPTPKKKRTWVWAVVGVSAAVVVGGVVAGVVLGVRASRPSGGSLGLIDGRTP
jgi:hypothetical protein